MQLLTRTTRLFGYLVFQCVLLGCGGGGSSAQNSTPTYVAAPLSAASASLAFTQVKTFSFSWSDVDDASYYRLLENVDGQSGFSVVVDNIPAGTQSVDLEVPLCHRLNASYFLQSCNPLGCTDASTLPVSGALIDSIGYFKASNVDAADQFGFAVSLSDDGQTLAVGAPSEDSAAQGVNGDQSNNGQLSAGAVYVFSQVAGSWQQAAYLKASNTDSGDQFGYSLALSGDATTLAVGAHFESSNAGGVEADQANNLAAQAGAVYVFAQLAGSWVQQAYIKAPVADAGDRFGWSLDLSGDGDRLAVTAPNESSNATALSGDSSDNSAAAAGAAYLYQRSGDNWALAEYFKAANAEAGDLLGFSVSLNDAGDTLVVGAHGEASADSGVAGNPLDNSAAYAGAVYVFTEGTGVWAQQAYLKASNTDAEDRFGWSVSLSDSGDTLAVATYGESSAASGIGGDQADDSAPDAGAVYIFQRDNGSWLQQQYIKAVNTEALDLFGSIARISGDGNSLLVGAYAEASSAAGVLDSSIDNSRTGAGAVYLYTRENDAWSAARYVKASVPDSNDLFGWSLAVSANGETLAVGAQRESSAATGIAGGAGDNSAADAGAVYLY